MEEQDNLTKFTGFNSYSTLKPYGFNEGNMVEFISIINSFEASDEFRQVKKLFNDTIEHINNTDNPHQFDVKTLKEGLINQLFNIYKEYQYTGDKTKMFNDIVKDVKIAADYIAKYSRTSTDAITAQQFKDLFKLHNSNIESHYNQFKNLDIQTSFNIMPTFTFMHSYDEDVEWFYQNGYTLLNWNSSEGTLVFEFTYNQNFLDAQYFFLTYADIERIPDTNEHTYHVHYLIFHYNVLRNLFCIGDNGSEKELVLPVSFTIHDDPIDYYNPATGREKLVITYKNGDVLLRNGLHKVTYENCDIFNHDMINLYFGRSFYSDGSYPINLELTYYSCAATEREAVSLLK